MFLILFSKFKCQDGADDYIASVEEPITCAYMITVKTDRICHHPALKLLSLKQSVPIVCNPILSPEDYADYLEMRSSNLQSGNSICYYSLVVSLHPRCVCSRSKWFTSQWPQISHI